MDNGNLSVSECDETEEDSPSETCVSPGGGTILPSNSREQRNKAEKQRRDRLNSYIGELANLVPMVAKSAKRLDKTSILRLTATHLRIKQMLNNSKVVPNMTFPKEVDQILLEQLIYEQMGGFLLIMLSTGKIVFISNTVENLLGHLQTDLMGQSLFNITAPEDHDRLKMFLQCEGDIEHDWRKYFTIRLKRAGPRSESPVYEQVKMMGMHRQGNNQNSIMSSNSSTASSSSSSSNANPDDILIFFVKVCRPEPFIERLMEASKEEYVTRHLIDGRIIGCDQRISIIAGYMTEEVMCHSAFLYMHKEDVRWVMIALRQMYDRGEMRGSSCYRLQSRNGQFIFLRTNGFLEIDDQGIVESFICVNTLISEVEGLQLIDDMKKRYSAICSLESLTPPPSNDSIEDEVEDPLQLEQAVAHLMSNLATPASTEDVQTGTSSPLITTEKQDCTVIPTTEYSAAAMHKYQMKRPKRSPSDDKNWDLYGCKRQKAAGGRIRANQSYTVTTVKKEIKKDPETPLYQHDQFLSHNL
ncbi:circadian locomoter output cycles protein kaput-like isoform X2 [Diorhabda carinulata]|uniref:circadian locomoter output cycles protein kaput-like isoform X2 n=1 Tax=Diorhabda sublineata TaxID=1163346 RepID=UPI0024E09849|nr:circadian locomoter output cycles protein kaput-like isoform X2 [Diorhabda sublineata]XP_057665606.1 circadian locomoter output cycles protein kaput-like isoform X2 [Diorhabda carinulata]